FCVTRPAPPASLPLSLHDALPISIDGVEAVFARPVFHEAVLRLPAPVGATLQALEARGIVGGFALVDHYPELGQALLVCATETRTPADIERYATELADVLRVPSRRRARRAPVSERQ